MVLGKKIAKTLGRKVTSGGGKLVKKTPLEKAQSEVRKLANKKNMTLKNFRIKNLELFKTIGFPNKRLEDWKFTDFKNIVENNPDDLEDKS